VHNPNGGVECIYCRSNISYLATIAIFGLPPNCGKIFLKTPVIETIFSIFSIGVENVPALVSPEKQGNHADESITLKKSVGSRFLAQALDSTALQKNTRLTEWVKLRFF
jgi:hypothetical protein